MRSFDTCTEVADELARRSPSDASTWFADWLRHRDELSAKIAAEQLAESLEVIAAELRGEAHQRETVRTRGLLLAATVLTDTATGMRVGDTVTAA